MVTRCQNLVSWNKQHVDVWSEKEVGEPLTQGGSIMGDEAPPCHIRDQRKLLSRPGAGSGGEEKGEGPSQGPRQRKGSLGRGAEHALYIQAATQRTAVK